MLSRRSGFTLLELMIALALSGLVLALTVALGAREQRAHASAALRLDRAERLRHAAELLPIDVRALDPSAGDLRGGEARDTSLEIRATIVYGVVCSVQEGRVALVPRLALDGLLSSVVSLPQMGDTLWLLTDSAGVERWAPHTILASGPERGACAAGESAGLLPPADDSLPARVLELEGLLEPSRALGAPVRITRAMRYAFYRSGDGGWYLGVAEWIPERLRFDVVQPVSGPYASAARGGLRFRYFDAAGIEVPSGAADTRGVGRIEVSLLADDRVATGSDGSATTRDSLLFVIALRNAP